MNIARISTVAQKVNGGMSIQVRVIPSSGVNKLEVIPAESLVKAKLTAPPVEGRANRQLIKVLADYLDLPKSSISILKGESSKNKIIKIALE